MLLRQSIDAVETATPDAPKRLVKMTVPSEEIRMLTTLFPTSIDVIVLSKFSASFSVLCALLLPFAASCLRRILLTEDIAVSIDEKSAENAISTIIAVMAAGRLSKVIFPFF